MIDSGDARVPRTARTPCSAPGIPIAPTWVVTMFGGFAVLLVPWVVWLSLTLPPAQRESRDTFLRAFTNFGQFRGRQYQGLVAAVCDGPLRCSQQTSMSVAWTRRR